MNLRWIGILCVVAAAGGIVTYKEMRTPFAAALAQSPVVVAQPEVLLFADLREADQDCGCGQIIRSVRAAGARGVSIREVAPGSDPKLEKQFDIKVSPTVLVVDATGRVLGRHEGEAKATVDAVRADLDRLAKRKP